MHFRGEGKTPLTECGAQHGFYPMHFRGEGKTVVRKEHLLGIFYPMHFRGEGKTVISHQTSHGRFYPMHFRGEGKTKLAAGWCVWLDSWFLTIPCPIFRRHTHQPAARSIP